MISFPAGEKQSSYGFPRSYEQCQLQTISALLCINKRRIIITDTTVVGLWEGQSAQTPQSSYSSRLNDVTVFVICQRRQTQRTKKRLITVPSPHPHLAGKNKLTGYNWHFYKDLINEHCPYKINEQK